MNQRIKNIIKNYYLWITIAEIVILLIGGLRIAAKDNIAVTFDKEHVFADTAEGRVYINELNPENAETLQQLRTEEMCLDKGIYNISVVYRATDGGSIDAISAGAGPDSLWAETAKLTAARSEKSYQIWANDPLEKFYVQIASLGGTLTVEEVMVETAANSKWYQILCLFVKLTAINLLAGVYYSRDRLRKYSVEIIGLAGITLIASVGVLSRYMLPGHDLVFHLLRIEGLKDGILSGAFPVRIQPNWCNGWGYAVSVMYGDTTLILPALMRMAGFTVQTSYKTFIIVVNIMTAGISYYTFFKICKNKYIALLGSLLYVAAPYRLCCIYLRAAFGEYTAMMFLPLIALGFWYAFGERIGERNYGKNYVAPVIGFTGLIQTHVLTCQMVAIFAVLLCLLAIKRVLRRKTFLYLVKIVLWTVLINLWFLVPFFRYFGEELLCTKMNAMAADYQVLGVSLAELFAQETSGFYGYSWSELTSLKHKFSIPLGNGLLLCGVLALLLLWQKKLADKRMVKVVLLFGILSVWMATNLFPYHLLQVHFPKMAAFLAKPGLPYRYLILACLFLSLLAVFVFWKSKGRIRENVALALFLVIGGTAVYQGFAYSYQTLYSGYYHVFYDGSLLDTTGLMGKEYLYEGSETWITDTDQTAGGEQVVILSQNKEYNRMRVVIEDTGENAVLDVPMFYYPGYAAYNPDDRGQEFEISRGGNNRIAVSLPEDYSGEVEVAFKEPVLWRVAELISGLAFIGMIMINRPLKRRKKQEGI